jgi:GSCFA family
VLLTVSPVSLVATYEDAHVLAATVYSKSALRVVAEMATRTFPRVGYFPSYEMITGPQARSAFFEDDLREIRPEGVAYVMSVFARHYLGGTAPALTEAMPAATRLLRDQIEVMQEMQGVICEEEEIDSCV